MFWAPDSKRDDSTDGARPEGRWAFTIAFVYKSHLNLGIICVYQWDAQKIAADAAAGFKAKRHGETGGQVSRPQNQLQPYDFEQD